MKKSIISLVIPLTLVGCSPTSPTQTIQETNQPLETAPEEADVTELQIEEIEVGQGEEAKAGDTVEVHYTGWLTNGTKFDSSVDRGTPFSFSLGAGEVIEGWDQGVAGMKVGGKRKLTIPSDMAYGPQAIGAIPANSTLVFEVELLQIVE